MTPIAETTRQVVVPPRPHGWSVVFLLTSVALFWVPLCQLVALSLDDARYSHLILIPLICAFFVHRERQAIFAQIKFQPRAVLPFLATLLASYFLLAFRVIPLSSDYVLTAKMFVVISVWAAGFALLYGLRALKAAMFPFLFLLLLVPFPLNLMDWVVSGLQHGSAELTYRFFSLLDVPMFRDGVRFELPGVGIEVAKECSSIHSGWALFITGVLVAHIFLQSMWTKASLSVLTIPIAMLTNAVRIVTLWFLGTHVDMGFLTGPLHHRGGILFSLISLSILMGCLYILRRVEPYVNPC